MKCTFYLAVSVSILVCACSNKSTSVQKFNAPAVIETTGYKVPEDSSKPPIIIPFDAEKFKTTAAGIPKIFATNTNIHACKQPDAITVSEPRIIYPGRDTFLLPTIFSVKDSSFIAGTPEINGAKDAHTKDQNPQNFSSFSKLQGLKHGNIRCLLEDYLGNIWLGTEGGGVSKYDGKSFTHYTDKEGLSYNDVRCMVQDSKHNIWFGTNEGGISCFDGKNFHHYKSNSGISDDDVLCILEDKNGNLWFGTDGKGVYKLTPSENNSDSIYFTAYTSNQGLASDIVWSMQEDPFGAIWFGTEGGGLSHFDGESFSNYSTEQGLPSNHIITLILDQKKNLWAGTEGDGVFKIEFTDPKNPKSEFRVSAFTTEQGLSDNVVRSILEDRDGNLWFGTIGGGVSKLVLDKDRNTDKDLFIHFATEEGLTNSAISSILQDGAGNIWFATYGGGISKYDGKLFTHFTSREGLASPNIWSMTEDASGNLWFGSGGAGVSKYDGQNFSHYTTAEGLAFNDVRSMLTDKAGNIWFGTIGKGVTKFTPPDAENPTGTFTHFNSENGLSGDDVRSMILDQYGNIWFAISGAGITKFDGTKFEQFSTEQGLSNEDARCILEDHSGNIWAATSGGGITKISQKIEDQKFVYSFTHITTKEGLAHDFVLCILEDKSNNLWFGTYGGGIARITTNSANNEETYSIVHLTEAEGIANNFVFSVLQDFSGNIWFGTRFGLSKLTPEKLNLFDKKLKSKSILSDDVFFKNYTYEDGFLGIGCNGKAMCQSTDGTIWIGTNDRLTAYHPPIGEEKPDTLAPNVQLTGISLFNETIDWVNFENKTDTSFILGNGVSVGDFEFDGITKWYGVPENLSLAYNNNYLTFNFIGITMNQPKRVKYQYKLEGLDENWSAITNRTEAPYGNLPHGDYTFKVKAMNCDGVWSSEYHYHFSIRPPYWKTWWFRTLTGIFILILLFGFYRWRTASLRSRQKQLEKTVAQRTVEVLEQKHLIEEKHKEITDSINYAERIQKSFLASSDLLNQHLNEHFVLFKPKDVVSGDFYWATELQDGKFVLVTADSTGHGVPGAIMSILNITCLEKAIDEMKLIDPAEILNHTRLSIIERLRKDGSVDGGKDGMDASVICFDLKKKTLTYAAANNPVWIIRNNEIIICQPDNMPVAKHDKQHIPFTSREVSLQSGDLVYALTDGYADQFGGTRGKKFMYKKLKQLLLSICNEPMTVQKEKLNETFHEWKGSLEQVDDVCVVGVRI